MLHAPSRRELLLASGTLFAWAYLPKLALAEGRDPRFLAVILRGAVDGLATVAPVGDPDWVTLRGNEALTLDSEVPALKLNDFFALNPAMPNLQRMYQANEAIIRISMGRICWKADCRNRRSASPAGSIACWPGSRRAAGSIQAAAASSRSVR